MIEAGVVVDLDGEALHWHAPSGRNGAALPDSRALWDFIWEHRDDIAGFAHSHPGSGLPGPSHTDVTTFAAIEAALGRRLIWWIASADRLSYSRWDGGEPLNYVTREWNMKRDAAVAEWLPRLRELSRYATTEKTEPRGEQQT